MKSATTFWNKRALSFDKYDNPNSKVRETTYKAIRTYLSKEDQVLEFACATGSLSFELMEDVKSIDGLDISPKMIEIANQKKAEKAADNVNFYACDVLMEDCLNKRYDVILAFYVFHLIPNKEEVLEKLMEYLKPGGKIIIESPCLKEASWLKRISTILFSRLMGLPYIAVWSKSDLTDFIRQFNLKIVDTYYKNDKFPRLFIVAKK